MTRLRWALAVCGWLAATSASAQNPISAVGVFSLLGDSVQITSATAAPSDSRLERTSRESMTFKDIGFDLIASRAAREALLKAHPQAQVSAFRASGALEPTDQLAVAEGAARGELPAWMVQTIAARNLSHVLIITRGRGTADLRTADDVSIGRGTVEGIGFYLDTLYQTKDVKTGAIAAGLIGTYAQMQLTLMDTQTAQLVAQYSVRDGVARGPGEDRVDADPWSFLSPQQKVIDLRRIVEQGMARGMAQLLSTR